MISDIIEFHQLSLIFIKGMQVNFKHVQTSVVTTFPTHKQGYQGYYLLYHPIFARVFLMPHVWNMNPNIFPINHPVL